MGNSCLRAGVCLDRVAHRGCVDAGERKEEEMTHEEYEKESKLLNEEIRVEAERHAKIIESLSWRMAQLNAAEMALRGTAIIKWGWKS